MKIQNAIINYLMKFIIAILAFCCLYFLVALILTIIPCNTDYQETKNENIIFVSTNGVHTNIILPVKSEQINWLEILKINENCNYLEFGWGDKEFYLNTPTWDQIKFSTAFKAGFLPTNTIIQIYCIKHDPIETKRSIKLSLNNKQFNKLTTFVKKSFKLDSTSSVIEVEPNNSFYLNTFFYEAKGTYSIFNTCNNWTNKGLKHAGIKNSIWAPFDKSVLYHIQN